MFDPNKPYGEVSGMARVRYIQDGKFYGPGKNFIRNEGDPEELETPIPEPILTAIAKPDYEGMLWQAVKKLVVEAGGEWTNKKEGIAYLEGL